MSFTRFISVKMNLSYNEWSLVKRVKIVIRRVQLTSEMLLFSDGDKFVIDFTNE
jgi:hypothetical protein